MVVTCPNCGTKNRVDEGAASRRQPVCGRCRATLSLTATASADEGKPLKVTDETFEREVLGVRGIPVLLDCWAEWCQPCLMLDPTLNELAAEANGRYRIAKLNIDENPRTAAHFKIRSIPALLIFKDGALVDRFLGAKPKHKIADRLRKSA
jgi:thioredoxin